MSDTRDGSRRRRTTSSAGFWRASAAAMAVPNDPPPNTTTLSTASSALRPSAPRCAFQFLRDHRISWFQDLAIFVRSDGG